MSEYEYTEGPVYLLNEIGAALAKAQLEMSNPTFDRTNPHFRNKFASLAAVRNAVIPILAKHGISLIQDLTAEGNVIFCTTILTHASGQQMRLGPLPMPATKADAQGFGSAATYARRYALMAVAGVVGDEDDDANEATGKAAPSTEIKPGIGVHNPLGDITVTDQDRLYASVFIQAVANGDIKAVRLAAADLHNEGEERYRAVWSLLDSKCRSSIKKILADKEAA